MKMIRGKRRRGDKTRITGRAQALLSNKKAPLIPAAGTPSSPTPALAAEEGRLAIVADLGEAGPATTSNSPAALPLRAATAVPGDDRIDADDRPGEFGLAALFSEPRPVSTLTPIVPLRAIDDVARFINTMQRRNEAREIAGMSATHFSLTQNEIEAFVTGRVSTRQRHKDLDRLDGETVRGRDVTKTLRVARYPRAGAQEYDRTCNAMRLAKLRQAYECGLVEGVCAVVYGANGSAHLFVRSRLSIPLTLAAIKALRLLPYWQPAPPGYSGVVDYEESRFYDFKTTAGTGKSMHSFDSAMPVSWPAAAAIRSRKPEISKTTGDGSSPAAARRCTTGVRRKSPMKNPLSVIADADPTGEAAAPTKPAPDVNTAVAGSPPPSPSSMGERPVGSPSASALVHVPGKAMLADATGPAISPAADRLSQPWLDQYPAETRPALAEHGLDPGAFHGAHDANVRIVELVRRGVSGDQLADEAAKLVQAFVLEDEKEVDLPDDFDWYVEVMSETLEHKPRRKNDDE